MVFFLGGVICLGIFQWKKIPGLKNQVEKHCSSHPLCLCWDRLEKIGWHETITANTSTSLHFFKQTFCQITSLAGSTRTRTKTPFSRVRVLCLTLSSAFSLCFCCTLNPDTWLLPSFLADSHKQQLPPLPFKAHISCIYLFLPVLLLLITIQSVTSRHLYCMCTMCMFLYMLPYSNGLQSLLVLVCFIHPGTCDTAKTKMLRSEIRCWKLTEALKGCLLINE